MSDDVELDYAYLAQDALRGVVRSVLETTVSLGMPPGEHHFYIEFATGAPGVALSPRLKQQYPERMTIVLQHQFEGLEVDADGFGVTLHFNNAPERLIIPFAAVTAFSDPSASFGLQFAALDAPAEEEQQDHAPSSADVQPLRPAGEPGGEGDQGPDDDGDGGGSGGADVVSLDRFRKK